MIYTIATIATIVVCAALLRLGFHLGQRSERLYQDALLKELMNSPTIGKTAWNRNRVLWFEQQPMRPQLPSWDLLSEGTRSSFTDIAVASYSIITIEYMDKADAFSKEHPKEEYDA